MSITEELDQRIVAVRQQLAEITALGSKAHPTHVDFCMAYYRGELDALLWFQRKLGAKP